jgi:hypothetical protein
MHRPASLVATILFFFMAAAQLCRAILGVQVIAGGVEIPIWLSFVAAAIVAALALWLLKERGREK